MMFQYFDRNLTHRVLYILLRHILNLKRHSWRCKYVGAELAFAAGVFLLKYTIYFQLHFFVIWSVSPSRSWSLFVQATLLKNDSQCFGAFAKFQHNIKIFLWTALVSRLFFCFVWLWFDLITPEIPSELQRLLPVDLCWIGMRGTSCIHKNWGGALMKQSLSRTEWKYSLSKSKTSNIYHNIY